MIVAQDDLNTFLAVAEDLEVKGLTETPQKLQPASQYQPAAKISTESGYARENQDTQHSKATGYETQDRNRDIDQTIEKTEHVHDRDVEYIDPYLPPVLKTEAPVVDVESDSEYVTEQPLVQHENDSEYGPEQPLVHHESDYSAEQGGYEYQQGYQKINMGYQEPVRDTSPGQSVFLQNINNSILYLQTSTTSTQGSKAMENIFVTYVESRQETCML